MREPDFGLDGWCLESGEERHEASPDTFWIPPLDTRQTLQPGDVAKLIFRLKIEGDESAEAVERMWVIVRERTEQGYVGELTNAPFGNVVKGTFRMGMLLPFEARHVIDIEIPEDDG